MAVGIEGEVSIEGCAGLAEDRQLLVEARLRVRGTDFSAWKSCTLLVTMWIDDRPAQAAPPIDCTAQAKNNGEILVRFTFSEYPRHRRYRATVTWSGVYGEEQVGSDGMAESPPVTAP